MTLHPDIERVALLGWHLYPASSHSRAGCIKNGTDLASCDLDQLGRWAREFPGCNWRVVFGPSGLWGLDCDVPPGHAQDGIANLAELVHVHGAIPPRPQARSGGGGLALFFRHQGEAIIGEAGHPAPGIDPRRGRHSQTIPPSRHWRTGQLYRWITPPWEIEAPAAPAWLLRLVAPNPAPAIPEWSPRLPDAPERRQRYAAAALRRAVERVVLAAEGTRNDRLNREAWAMARFAAEGSLDPREIAVAMTHAGRQAGLLPREIISTLTSALGAGARPR